MTRKIKEKNKEKRDIVVSVVLIIYPRHVIVQSKTVFGAR